MLSTSTIIDFQRKAAARAARQKKQPLVLFNVDTVAGDIRHTPNLGLYVAKGWRPVLDTDREIDPLAPLSIDEVIVGALSPKALRGSRSWAGHRAVEDLRLFVDKGGWGSDGEPALTVDELVSNLRSVLDALRAAPKDLQGTVGIGIVEEGQFQLYLGVFVKESR